MVSCELGAKSATLLLQQGGQRWLHAVVEGAFACLSGGKRCGGLKDDRAMSKRGAEKEAEQRPSSRTAICSQLPALFLSVVGQDCVCARVRSCSLL